MIVPVLSSSSVSTSPAASTARPDMASTLKRTSRSMPAMPIAESSAPIVVGIRRDEQRDQHQHGDASRRHSAAKLGMVATANTKISVMPASRMLSAISFGVFCRAAPSTSAIMRSRKVEPGLAVMRTLIASDITCVPPVTAERSPPASRITGADSPVIAASLTEATPSMTSPSPGMISPASTSTTSPWRSAVAGDGLDAAVGAIAARHGLGLGAPQARRLRLAAALGDRLGEVGEQHGEPQPEIDLEGEAEPRAAGGDVAQEQHGGERGDDRHHEHHRVVPEHARVELPEALADGGPAGSRGRASRSGCACRHAARARGNAGSACPCACPQYSVPAFIA